MLSLKEELLLLALHDEKGKVLSSSSAALPYGLTGAILLELAMVGKIDVDAKKLSVIKTTLTGDRVLDRASQIMSETSKQRSVKHWVRKLNSQMKRLKNDLIRQLVMKGVLAETEGKLLWVIPTKRYPARNAEPENKVRERIKRIILNEELPDERSTLLISLIKACNLVNEVFAKDERKVAKKRIKAMAEGEKVGKAIADTVNEAVMVAVLGAVTASMAASTTSSTC